MKVKRKRIPPLRRRRSVPRILVIIALTLSSLALVALLGLTYVMWQIGEHEYRRAMIYAGLDPDKEIPSIRYRQMPEARVEYEAFKQEIVEILDGDHIVSSIRDELQIDELFLRHCIEGHFKVLVGSEQPFTEVTDHFAHWAAKRGWHSNAKDSKPEHPTEEVKEGHFYEASLGRGPHSRLLVWWEPSDGRPSQFGHPIYLTYYTVSAQYVDSRCLQW